MDKANDYAIESLKQIITLSSAILALTITFLKDILGNTGGQVAYMWLVPFGWLWLLISIVLAWYGIVEAADKLGVATTTVYAFKTDKTTSPPVKPYKLYSLYQILSWFIPVFPTKERNQTRKLAASAQNYFVLGLIFLGMFAVLNLKTTFHKTTTSPATVETRISLDLLPAGLELDCDETRYLISGFETGKYKGDENLAERARNMGRLLRESSKGRQLVAVILVGSADKQPLRGSMKASYDSNAGLAQARAKWVQERLAEGYGDNVRPVIVLSTGPSFIGHNVPEEKLALDRSVLMCAVWSSSRPAGMVTDER